MSTYVLINNYKWNIVFTNEKDEEMKDGDMVNLGLTKYTKLEVKVRTDMDRKLIESTLIHELVHAYIFSYGYDLKTEENVSDFFGAKGIEIVKTAESIMKGNA